MRFHLTSSLAAAAMLGLVGQSNAFTPPTSIHSNDAKFVATTTSKSYLMAMSTTEQEEATKSPCAMPDDVIPESVTAQGLRSAVLTNADGELVNLGEQMGQGKSIVVFLRHLG